ncbi:hypothetical protein [Streptomyces hirsutus]|uniref:hypothetical protein n=1 Tax=Streptomyces hirsutus TaxID=35620 RepID=UPI0030B83603
MYDPDERIEAGLPLDREPYDSLIKAVLAWTCPDTLAIRDYPQIALQLTGHPRAVATELHQRADHLPKSSGPKALADLVLREAEEQLSPLPEGTMSCVKARARTVRALYERLDRLEAPPVAWGGWNRAAGELSPTRQGEPPGLLRPRGFADSRSCCLGRSCVQVLGGDGHDAPWLRPF